MTPEWDRQPLRELVDERGITYGVVQPGQAQAGGVPILRVNNFADGTLKLDDVIQISPAIESRYARSRLRGGEVLLTLVGSTGQVGVATAGMRGWNVARAVGVIPVRPSVSSRWVAWCLQTPPVRAFLDARANTTVQKTLNLRDVAAVQIPIPPSPAINAIEVILAALDDKIDSNRWLAALLEETAAALFKARFVDFVGVEEFEESEIGPIPKSWWAGSLVDIAEFVNGRAFTKHASGKGRAIIRIRELNSGVDGQTPRAELDAQATNVASADDILFAWSGSLGVYRWPGDEALINQHIFKVIPTTAPAWCVDQWIRFHMPGFRSIAADKATTMGHIQRRHLSEARVAIPPEPVLRAFDQAFGPLDRYRASLVQETQALAAVRDELLPKLISGELRVPVSAADAEDLAEELVG